MVLQATNCDGAVLAVSSERGGGLDGFTVEAGKGCHFCS